MRLEMTVKVQMMEPAMDLEIAQHILTANYSWREAGMATVNWEQWRMALVMELEMVVKVQVMAPATVLEIARKN